MLKLPILEFFLERFKAVAAEGAAVVDRESLTHGASARHEADLAW